MEPVRLPIAKLPPAEEAAEETCAEPGELVQVGDLARETGKTVRALHLYEEMGLLTPHARSKGRYRLYGPEAIVRVRWISKLQEMGLSLGAITELVRDWGSSASAPMAMENLRREYQLRLQQTREQLQKLQALEVELISSLQYLELCGSCDPVRTVTQCTGCDLRDCDHAAPELVLGVQTSG